MVKIFLYKEIPKIPKSFLINLFLSKDEQFGPLFQKVLTAPFKEMIELVESPLEAGYMLLPHNFLH